MNVLSVDPWACVQASPKDTFLEVTSTDSGKTVWDERRDQSRDVIRQRNHFWQEGSLQRVPRSGEMRGRGWLVWKAEVVEDGEDMEGAGFRDPQSQLWVSHFPGKG